MSGGGWLAPKRAFRPVTPSPCQMLRQQSHDCHESDIAELRIQLAAERQRSRDAALTSEQLASEVRHWRGEGLDDLSSDELGELLKVTPHTNCSRLPPTTALSSVCRRALGSKLPRLPKLNYRLGRLRLRNPKRSSVSRLVYATAQSAVLANLEALAPNTATARVGGKWWHRR